MPRHSSALKPTHRWLQFSLRTLLVLIAVFAVLVGVIVNQARRQQRAVAAIQALGGWVHYDYQLDSTGRTKSNAKSWVPEWLLAHLEVDLFHDVVEVNMVYNEDGPKRLDNNLVGDEALEHLPALPGIKYLLLHSTQASDEGLRYVARLEDLEKLYIWNAYKISDDGIDHLRGLKWLKILNVSNSRITDKALEHLGSMRQIKYLSLQGNRFSDKGLEYIKDLTDLTSLVIDLGRITVTDEGLVYLRGLKKLECQGLQHSLVTDRGLEQLRGLKNLKELWLSGTGVTAAGVQELKNSLPKLTIDPSEFPKAETSNIDSEKSQLAQALQRKVSLNFKSALLDAVLTFFRNYTGLEIVCDNAAIERSFAQSRPSDITIRLTDGGIL